MKRTFILIFLISISSGVLFSQGIYFRAGGGYAFPIATSSLGEINLQKETTDGTKTSTRGVTGSLGSGINFNLAFGYKFNDNFSFELNSQYLNGKKYESSDKYIYSNGSFTYGATDVSTTSAKALFINPSFIFTGGFGKAAPYGRFGIIIGSPKISGDETFYYNGDGTDSTQRKWELSKGISFGFQGAVGMNWKLSEKLDFYTEVNYISMSYYPGEYNLVMDKDLQTGYDNMGSRTAAQKRTVFKRQFDPGVNNDETKPHTALRESAPLSSISLQAGLRIALWNKKTE